MLVVHWMYSSVFFSVLEHSREIQEGICKFVKSPKLNNGWQKNFTSVGRVIHFIFGKKKCGQNKLAVIFWETNRSQKGRDAYSSSLRFSLNSCFLPMTETDTDAEEICAIGRDTYYEIKSTWDQGGKTSLSFSSDFAVKNWQLWTST